MQCRLSPTPDTQLYIKNRLVSGLNVEKRITSTSMPRIGTFIHEYVLSERFRMYDTDLLAVDVLCLVYDFPVPRIGVVYVKVELIKVN